MSATPLELSADIASFIRQLTDSKRCNMGDYPTVLQIAQNEAEPSVAVWLAQNAGHYMHAVSHGFVVSQQPEDTSQQKVTKRKPKRSPRP